MEGLQRAPAEEEEMDTISSEGHVGEGCGAVVKSNIYDLAWPSDTSLQL